MSAYVTFSRGSYEQRGLRFCRSVADSRRVERGGSQLGLQNRPASEELANAVAFLKEAFLSGEAGRSLKISDAERLLAQADENGETAAEGWVLLARHYYLSCRHEDVVRCSAKAAALARRWGCDYLLRTALMLEGSGKVDRQEFGAATRIYAEALELARKLKDDDGEASVLNNIGVTMTMFGEYSRAVSVFRLAASKSELILPAATANIALCAVHCQAPDLLESIELESVRFTETREGQYFRAALYANLSRLALQSREFEQARAFAKQCDEAALSGDARTVRAARLTALIIDVANGKATGLGGLRALLDEAEPSERFDVMAALAEAYELAGMHDEALRALREVIRSSREYQQSALVPAPEVSLVPGGLDERLEARAEELEQTIAQLLTRFTEAAIRAQLATGHDVYRVYRLGKLAGLFGQSLGLSGARVEDLVTAGRLFDIGLLALPKLLLQRAAALGPTQRNLLERHTYDGAEMLRGAGLAALSLAAQVAEEHHEHWDGCGYPAGKKGDGISLEAQIISLCDSFDALSHSCPPAPALSISSALRQLQSRAGTQFDEVLCEHFVRFVRDLFWQHDDLDKFLAEEGRSNPLVLAREHMDRLLARDLQAGPNPWTRSQPESGLENSPM